jgi:hypothetical protein
LASDYFNNSANDAKKGEKGIRKIPTAMEEKALFFAKTKYRHTSKSFQLNM